MRSSAASGGFEAAFFNKPTITLIENDYSNLPSVNTVKSISELPQAIKSSLKQKVDPASLTEFIKTIENNTFSFDMSSMIADFYSRFYLLGFLIVEKEITNNQMKIYLNDHKESFELLAREHIKKIKQHNSKS